MKAKKKTQNLQLIPDTLTPWSASGPGWSNAGVTARVRDQENMKEIVVTLYRNHFDPVILKTATILVSELERQFSVALKKGHRR